MYEVLAMFAPSCACIRHDNPLQTEIHTHACAHAHRQTPTILEFILALGTVQVAYSSPQEPGYTPYVLHRVHTRPSGRATMATS